MDKSPAFQFYPKDWLSDLNVVRMTLEEQGAYMRLLCHQWLEGQLPANTSELARVVGVSSSRFARMWRSIAPCFALSDDGATLSNGRLEVERSKQADWREKSRAGGKRSAAKRKGGARVVKECLLPESQPTEHQGATLLSSVFCLQSSKEPPTPAPASLVFESESEPVTTPEPDPEASPDAPREPAGFVRLYEAYPHKCGRQAALKAWRKLKPAESLVEVMLDAIAAQLDWRAAKAAAAEWAPEWAHPATWLNAGRWADELEPPKRPRTLGPDYAATVDWFSACRHEPKCDTGPMHAIRCGIDLVDTRRPLVEVPRVRV